MRRIPRKYVVDTNLFVDAFRDATANEALQQFHRAFAPFEYLSTVVAHELESGVKTPAARRSLRRYVLDPFIRRGRTLTPAFSAWQDAGVAISKLTIKGKAGTITRAFANDVLIAASCRESGVTLVTNNVRDFERIKEVLQFNFVSTWPRP